MMKRRPVFLVLAVILVFALAMGGCGKKENAPIPGTTPIGDLLAAGKAPVVLGSMVRSISPVAPTFMVSVTNVSDCSVKSITGTVVYFDKDGKYLPDAKADSGYAELTAIKPGERIELSTMTNDENAVTGRWIVKQVIYMKMNPVDKLYGELPYKWNNPNYDTELEAALKK
jgi:hypothetical protein